MAQPADHASDAAADSGRPQRVAGSPAAAHQRRYASLAAILIAATLLQGLLWARLPTISADGIIFIRIARGLAVDPLATMRLEDQHPGFPALVLGTTRLVQALGVRGEPEAWVLGGMLVSFFCGIASIAIVWFLARDLFDERVANVAAIVFTVLPLVRAGAVDAQSDTPHATFYLLAAWLATTGIKDGNRRRLAGAGLASGLAFWIRPEGLEVALVALPVLVMYGWRAGWGWRQLSSATAALGVTAFLVAAPYVLLAGKLTSKQLQFFKTQPIPTYLSQLAVKDGDAVAPPSAVATNPPAAAPQAPPVAQPAAPPEAPAPAPPPASVPTVAPSPAPALAPPASLPGAPPHPPRYRLALILSVLGNALAAFIESICQGFKYVFIPLYLFGDVALAWRRPPGVQVAFLALLGAAHIGVLLAVFVISGYIAHRHVLVLVGLAMPFVALGIVELGAIIGRRVESIVQKKPRAVADGSGLDGRLPTYCTVAILMASCALVLPYTLRHLNREFVPVMEATAWVEGRAKPGEGILCNSPYVKFYGTLPVAELCSEAPAVDQALARAPAARYDYVVMHVNAHGYQPLWLAQLAPHYRPVREFPDLLGSRKDRKVVVLEAVRPIQNAALPTQ